MRLIINEENKKQHYIELKPHKRVNQDSPDIDLNLKSYQMFERIDLLAIEGMSFSTVLVLMSEVGFDGSNNSPQQNILIVG
jgi:transposase